MCVWKSKEVISITCANMRYIIYCMRKCKSVKFALGVVSVLNWTTCIWSKPHCETNRCTEKVTGTEHIHPPNFNIISPSAITSSSDSFNPCLQNKTCRDVSSLPWTLQVSSKQHDLECSKIAWKKELSRKDKMNENAVLCFRNFDSFLC
jgi:hypothetical protein